MKLQLRRSVFNYARQIQNSLRGVGPFLCAFICIAIMVLAVTSPAAAAVVHFDLNYILNGTNGPTSSFEVELYDNVAPITVANFLKYVNDGLYDNTIFHRSVSNFVVQGGGFTPTIQNGTTTAFNPIKNYGPIKNEFSPDRSNLAGTIAMAKVGGDPNSASNQWFVNMGNNSANLDNQNGGFTVFGKILGNGMDLFKSINGLPTKDLSASFGTNFKEVPTFDNGKSLVTIKDAYTIPPSKLSGFIYLDKNHNGVMDSEDVPIVGTKVLIKKTGGNTPWDTVYTGDDGSYNFNNLDAGQYTVYIDQAYNQPGSDKSKGQTILDKDGNIVSIGTNYTALSASNFNVTLGREQAGKNFNIAQSAYPVLLVSSRDVLSSTNPPATTVVAVPGTNATSTTSGSVLDFGKALVGTPDKATLTVTNNGAKGSQLSGTFPKASGEFGPADATAFGPLDSGKAANQQYTYTPSVRGASTPQNLVVTSNAGNMKVTLSGTGVAPVQSVNAPTALVRIGTTGKASVIINNIGDGNLSGLGEVSNLKGSVPALTGTFAGTGGNINLADNISTTFDYTYTATDRKTDTQPIVVSFSNGNTDGKNTPQTVNTNISAQGVGPTFSTNLTAGSTTIDFGTLPLADTKPFTLTITNSTTDLTGTDTTLTDLTLLSATFTGTDKDLFSPIIFPDKKVLHKGDTFDLKFEYSGTGTVLGDKSAELSILTDQGAAFDHNGKPFTFQIKANLANGTNAVSITPAPEPSTLLTLAIAGLCLGGLTWRRRTAKKS